MINLLKSLNQKRIMEYDKSLENYLFPCIRTHTELIKSRPIIKENLKKLQTKEGVRNFFLGQHNEKVYRKNPICLAKPYEIISIDKEKIKTILVEPFFKIPDFLKTKNFTIKEINEAQERGINLMPKIGKIIIYHATHIVDYISKQDLKNIYDSINNENPSFWKPSCEKG